MREAFLAMCLTAICAASGSAQSKELTAFDWLAGRWESSEGGRTIEEQWTTPSSNLMIGMSRTVRDGRATGFEFLRIEKRGADLFYVPQPSGRPPVAFKLVSETEGRFVFENLTGEDRVSRIEYRREGSDGLYARVEGAEKQKPFTLEFHFKRRN